MNESGYVEMANKLNQYLENYCGLNNKTPDNATDVGDLLTDLIHMNREGNENQEGGILIEEVMENLTGGNVSGKQENQSKGDEVMDVVYKNIDTNLLEGGNAEVVNNEEQHEQEALDNNNSDFNFESSSDSGSDDLFDSDAIESDAEDENESQDNASIHQGVEQQVEQKVEQPKMTEIVDNFESDSSDSSFSDSDYSEFSDFNNVECDGVESCGSTNEEYSPYEAFLKHYKDNELKRVFKGGDNAVRNNKIQIIPMFPYLLRY